jgi:DNA repair protein RadC
VNELIQEHQQHRERLRTKYLLSGISALHDYEILELLLTFVIPRRDVKPLAKKLINKFSSIAGVIDAPESDLLKVSGIGKNSVVMLHFLKDLCAKYLEDKSIGEDVVSNPESVIKYAQVKLGGLRYEAFITLFLNTRNHVISNTMVEGTVDCTAIYPRDIIKQALDLNATGIIIIHNHPSGSFEPSRQDINLTMKIKTACESINIRLLDHLIVGRSGHCSLAERGTINAV